MNRLIQFAIACCFSLVAFAANPSFNSFDTTQFDIRNTRVALTNGVIITNLVVMGTTTNTLEVWDASGNLRFVINTNGVVSVGDFAGEHVSLSSITNTSNEIQMNLLDNNGEAWVQDLYAYVDGTNVYQVFLIGKAAFKFTLLDPHQDFGLAAYILDTSKPVGSGNLLEVKNQGTNKFVVPWDGAISIPGDAVANSLTITNDLNVRGSLKVNTMIVTNNVSFYNNTYVSNFFATAATITNSITVQGDYIGTIDPTASGTTLKLQKSLKLQFPRYVDNAGCTYSNTNDYTALTFMLPQFSGTGATNANYCDFAFRVPADLDTSKDLTGSLTIRLTAADTGAHTYDVGMVSIANSAAAAGTPANYVALTISGDGSGASGDIESVSGVTLTSWRSNMTAGQWCLLRLNRDGANDASTVASNLMELEIFYWATQ